VNVEIPTLLIAVRCKNRILGPSGQISVRFAALEEMSQTIASFLEGAIKLVHALGIGGNSSRVHVSDYFEA